MTATVPMTVGTGRSMVRRMRAAMATTAIVTLLIVSFIVGRGTATTSYPKAATARTAHVQSDPFACPRRGPC